MDLRCSPNTLAEAVYEVLYADHLPQVSDSCGNRWYVDSVHGACVNGYGIDEDGNKRYFYVLCTPSRSLQLLSRHPDKEREYGSYLTVDDLVYGLYEHFPS